MLNVQNNCCFPQLLGRLSQNTSLFSQFLRFLHHLKFSKHIKMHWQKMSLRIIELLLQNRSWQTRCCQYSASGVRVIGAVQLSLCVQERYVTVITVTVMFIISRPSIYFFSIACTVKWPNGLLCFLCLMGLKICDNKVCFYLWNDFGTTVWYISNWVLNLYHLV